MNEIGCMFDKYDRRLDDNEATIPKDAWDDVLLMVATIRTQKYRIKSLEREVQDLKEREGEEAILAIVRNIQESITGGAELKIAESNKACNCRNKQ